MFGKAGGSGAGGGNWRSPWQNTAAFTGAALTAQAPQVIAPLLQNVVPRHQTNPGGVQLRNPFEQKTDYPDYAPAGAQRMPQSQNSYRNSSNNANPFASARDDQESATFDSMSMKRSMQQNQNRQNQASYNQYTQSHGSVSRSNDRAQSAVSWQLRANGSQFMAAPPPPPPPPPPEEPGPPMPLPVLRPGMSGPNKKSGPIPLMSLSVQLQPKPTTVEQNTSTPIFSNQQYQQTAFSQGNDTFSWSQGQNQQHSNPLVPSIMKAPVSSPAQQQQQTQMLGQSFTNFADYDYDQSSIFGNHNPLAQLSELGTVFGAPLQQLPTPTQTWFQEPPPPLPEEETPAPVRPVPAPAPVPPPVSESSGFWKKASEEVKAPTKPTIVQPLSLDLPFPTSSTNKTAIAGTDSQSTGEKQPSTEAGGIITTNLSALMDIIVSKPKDPNLIPGLGDIPPESEEKNSERMQNKSKEKENFKFSVGENNGSQKSHKISSAPKSVISDVSVGSEGSGGEAISPLANEKKELKAFDKKFREWEKQFEDWKAANVNHPDRQAYDKYLGQWEAIRQQLISQRRVIIERMNKIRMDTLMAEKNSFEASRSENTKGSAAQKSEDDIMVLEPIGVASRNEANIGRKSQKSPPITSEKLPNPSFSKATEIKSNEKVEEKPMDPEELKMKSFLKSGAVGIAKNDKVEQARSLIANPVALLGKGKGKVDAEIELDDPTLHSDPVDPFGGRQPQQVNILMNMNQMNRFGAPSRLSGPVRYPGTQFGPVGQPPRPRRPSDQNSGTNLNSALPKRPTISARALKVAGSSKYDDDWEPNWREIEFQRRKDAEKEQQERGHGAGPNYTQSFDPHSRENEFHQHQHPSHHFNEDRGNMLGRVEDQAEARSSSLSENMFTRRNTQKTDEDEVGVVVFDYGHGSSKPKIEAMYSRVPRSGPTRPTGMASSYSRGEDDEEMLSEAAVIDYGHGSEPVTIIPPKPAEKENSEEDDAARFHARFEDDYYDECNKEPEPEPQPAEFEYPPHPYPGGPTVGFPPHMRGPMMRPRFGPFGPRFFPPMMGPRYHFPMGPRFRPPFYPPGPYAHPYDYGYPHPYPYPYEEEEYEEEAPAAEETPAESSQSQSSYVRGIRVAPPLEPGDIADSKSGRSASPPSSTTLPVRSAPPLSPTVKNPVRCAPPLSPTGKPPMRSAPRLSPKSDFKRVELQGDLDWVSPEPSPIRDQAKESRGEERRDRSRERDRDRKPRERSRSRERERHDRTRGRSRERDDRRRDDRNRERDSTRKRSSDRVYRGDSPRRKDRDHDSRRDRRSRSRSPVSRNYTSSKSNVPEKPSSSPSVLSQQVSRIPNPHNSASPRYQTVLIEDILSLPGRKKRPHSIFIILRGLPGSGKTHVAKLIKDREVESGGSAPRILSLDDYFLTGETEKVVKDRNGKETKEKVMVYEYEPELEDKYRRDLFKTFKKNIESGLFRFIILDCVNDKVRHFEEFANYATLRKFQVYIAELEGRVTECFLRNIHQRTKEEIQKIADFWEKHSYSLVKLDVRTLLQDEAIQDVEMEDVSDSENFPDDASTNPPRPKKQEAVFVDLEEEDEPEPSWVKSKWDTSEEKMNKLDGLNKKKKSDSDDENNVAPHQSMEAWLQAHLPEDYNVRRVSTPGKKRVRWADIEEKREQERAREIGFVVGHTNWNRFTDPTFGDSALTQTKFI